MSDRFPEHSPSPDAASHSDASGWSVSCLCAAWCGTCTEYASVFASLQARFPAVQFRWIDVEDEADLVDPLEVDNFPSILISQGATARFFGVVLPHLETVQRLIQAQLNDPDENGRSAARVAPEARALAARMHQSQR